MLSQITTQANAIGLRAIQAAGPRGGRAVGSSEITARVYQRAVDRHEAVQRDRPGWGCCAMPRPGASSDMSARCMCHCSHQLSPPASTGTVNLARLILGDARRSLAWLLLPGRMPCRAVAAEGEEQKAS